jgi:transcription initiation factor IIE alpha subunit
MADLFSCPRCHGIYPWTDGTETEFWCPGCGLESEAELCRVEKAGADEINRLRRRVAALEGALRKIATFAVFEDRRANPEAWMRSVARAAIEGIGDHDA